MTSEEFKECVREANGLIGPIGDWLQAQCSKPFVALLLIRLADRVLMDKVAITSGITPEQINKIFAAMTVRKEGPDVH